jgi:hypothetical protein
MHKKVKKEKTKKVESPDEEIDKEFPGEAVDEIDLDKCLQCGERVEDCTCGDLGYETEIEDQDEAFN